MKQINISISEGYYVSGVTDSNKTVLVEVTQELKTILENLNTYMDLILTPEEKVIEWFELNAPDEVILANPDVIKQWGELIGQTLKEGRVVAHEGSLYRVLQTHRSQADWIPPDAVSLYTRINPPGTIGPWRQPQGAHDAYQMGDKVTHKDQTWVSTADNNVWEPGVYGWEIA